MPAAVPRVALALVAVVIIVWLGVLLRDTRLLNRGLGVPDAREAQKDLRAARLLNPDTAPDAARGLRFGVAGDRRRALAVYENVARREPDNFYVWGAILTLVRGRDAATQRRALAALRRIDPLDARRLGG
jgi:hypothetical protein